MLPIQLLTKNLSTPNVDYSPIKLNKKKKQKFERFETMQTVDDNYSPTLKLGERKVDTTLSPPAKIIISNLGDYEDVNQVEHIGDNTLNKMMQDGVENRQIGQFLINVASSSP